MRPLNATNEEPKPCLSIYPISMYMPLIQCLACYVPRDAKRLILELRTQTSHQQYLHTHCVRFTDSSCE